MKVKAAGKTYDVTEISLGEMSDIVDEGETANMLMKIAGRSVKLNGKSLGLEKLRALRASAYQPLIMAVKNIHLPAISDEDETKKD